MGENITQFVHPFSCIISGPSNSGKSFFIKQMLEHGDVVLSQMPQNIVWFYSCWQPLYKELLNKFPYIKFMEGLPSSFEDDDLFPPNQITLAVIDDLMASASDSDQIEKAFTQYVHHRNLSIILILQNLFFQGKKMRTIALNSKYLVLFSSPRDQMQIVTLARQMYPTNTKYFLEVFQDATRKPHGYLLVDLAATTPESYRLRTGLFPPDWPTVYTMKKKSKKQ